MADDFGFGGDGKVGSRVVIRFAIWRWLHCNSCLPAGKVLARLRLTHVIHLTSWCYSLAYARVITLRQMADRVAPLSSMVIQWSYSCH